MARSILRSSLTFRNSITHRPLFIDLALLRRQITFNAANDPRLELYWPHNSHRTTNPIRNRVIVYCILPASVFRLQLSCNRKWRGEDGQTTSGGEKRQVHMSMSIFTRLSTSTTEKLTASGSKMKLDSLVKDASKV